MVVGGRKDEAGVCGKERAPPTRDGGRDEESAAGMMAVGGRKMGRLRGCVTRAVPATGEKDSHKKRGG